MTDSDRLAANLPTARTIAIAGGGQLAQMMIHSAADLDLDVVVLDPDSQCSSARCARELIVAPFDDHHALLELGQRGDVVTFEIEKISVAALQQLEQAGIPVRPSAQALGVIQDKLQQKQFLVDHDLPTSDFVAFTSSDSPIDLPRVWKARRDGYDGRGVRMLRSHADVAQLPDQAALLESMVDIDRELAIVVARGLNGEIRHYPLTDIEMDPEAHVMRRVIAPANVSSTVSAICESLATRVVDALQYVGVLAIEFFLTDDGDILINELSPRPHNSGHYSIEACPTSQFEQHLRAVAGMPLGDTHLSSAAVTFNVLGDPDAHGEPDYVGFEQPPTQVFVHSYDKSEVRPGRKMGHVTVLGSSRDAAISLADRVQPTIRVGGNL